MSALQFDYRAGGIFLPALGLWLDAPKRVRGPERVLVSHAHSDHIAAHREVICTEATARFMRARLPGQRQEHRLAYGETRTFNEGAAEWRLTLLPAGHILGSAMARVQAGGRTLLYTGDFKLRPGRSAERCAPLPADVLIMETTFGRPAYVFPPTDAVMRGVIRFCREAIDNGETPVLLGYSLGKSQEILCGLAEAALPIVLHPQIASLTRVFEELGQSFPPYEVFGAGAARGKVVLCPPGAGLVAVRRAADPVRTAVLTGWAIDPACRFRYQCDAAFPVSDHADFPELLELVRQVLPAKVYTLHGFAADFARVLREQGFDAQALSEDEQLTLSLNLAADAGRRGGGGAIGRRRAVGNRPFGPISAGDGPGASPG